MKIKRHDASDAGQTVKKFLITVFVVMCISALVVCADYAGTVTGHRIDAGEIPVVTAGELEAFFSEALRNFFR